MSNRRKTRWGRKGMGEKISIPLPVEEAVILKRVPAVIHWAQVPSVDRDDDEIIGEALIYEDGEQDVVIFDGISNDAQKLLDYARGGVDHFSIADPQEN